MPKKSNPDYKDKVFALLDCYENGRELFRKADEAKTWDYPITLKDEHKNDPKLPDNWLGLVERVISIIAKEKYNLSTYDNRIEIITAGQMMDAIANIGLPIGYEHWSFGKNRIAQEKQYDAGGGMAYEIVINSAPSIAYCMEGNTPLMQILVIAHACFGHNNFFHDNYLFKEHTDAHSIFDFSLNLRNLIRACEDKYGIQEVEELIDSCHALKYHAINRTAPPPRKTAAELEEKARQNYLERASQKPTSSIYSKILPKEDFTKAANDNDNDGGINLGMEENILMFLANNAPHLPEWKRDIMRGIAGIQQYFYPQGLTQVMNEGWASSWHYTLVHDLSDLGLLNDSMMMEFSDSHTSVLFQPKFDETRTIMGPDGQPKKVNIYNGINPYALGFGIFADIKRICMEPTEEDKKWFPDIAGNGDWLSTWKFARDNFKDESFILQYLSPKLMRDFEFFAIHDDAENEYFEINAIDSKEGFENVRADLSAQYRRSDIIPRIGTFKYYDKTDRRLVLRHIEQDGKPLDKKDTDAVLKHIYRLWGHPVIIETVDEDMEKTKGRLSCPENIFSLRRR